MRDEGTCSLFLRERVRVRADEVAESTSSQSAFQLMDSVDQHGGRIVRHEFARRLIPNGDVGLLSNVTANQ